jgi:hypothetical protein
MIIVTAVYQLHGVQYTSNHIEKPAVNINLGLPVLLSNAYKRRRATSKIACRDNHKTNLSQDNTITRTITRLDSHKTRLDNHETQNKAN